MVAARRWTVEPMKFKSRHEAPFGGAFLLGHRPDIFRDEIERGRVVLPLALLPLAPLRRGFFLSEQPTPLRADVRQPEP
jgi:hypothetical protein